MGKIIIEPNFKDIRDTLALWVRELTGLSQRSVIWANQSATRPAKPYVMLNIIGPIANVGIDNVRQVYNAGTDTQDRIIIGDRRFTLSVNAYADKEIPPDDSDTIIQTLKQSSNTLTSNRILDAVGLAYIESPLTVLSDEQLGDRWEGRAIADIVFAYVAKTTETDAGIIESVEYSGTVKEANGDGSDDNFTKTV